MSAMASVSRASAFVGTPVKMNQGKSIRMSRTAVVTKAEEGEKKFDLFKLAGGRGIGAGELSLKTEEGEKELWAEEMREKAAAEAAAKAAKNFADGEEDVYVGQGRYMKGDSKKLPKKENIGFFIGATGGFAGGEEVLWQFRDEVKDEMKSMKKAKNAEGLKAVVPVDSAVTTLPLLMPGMNAIVTEPMNQYYNFTGIVQRVSDGKAQVLFEGGNWDKSATFMLEDLARAKSGPLATHPKSAILAEKVAELEAAAAAAAPAEETVEAEA